MPEPTLVIFLGSFGDSAAEQLVDQARLHATLDTLDGWNRDAVVVTDRPFDFEVLRVTVDTDTGPFHFGQRLAGVIRNHHLESVIYTGGGSLPLLPPEDLAAIADRLGTGVAATNNLYSCDLIAFPVSDSALAVIETVGRDNPLARALKEQAGLTFESLPRTLETQYDIDAPTDVAVLAATSLGGPRLRGYTASLDLDLSRYEALLPLFLDQAKQLLVSGRVGSHSWSYLERETACRVRLFAEERGMEADGRAKRGEVRSLLGYHLDAVGLGRFFATLADLADAAIIDTRVLLAHKRIDATREDRFLSDLGQWELITDPFLRDFTHAAADAAIPVLLGGHSLVSGGLMALNEHAWSLRDAGKL